MKFSPLYSLIPLSVSAVVTRTLTIEGMTPDCPDSCPGNQVDQPSEVGALIACFEALLTGEYPQCTFSGRVALSGSDKLISCYSDLNAAAADVVQAVGSVALDPVADMLKASFGEFVSEPTITLTPSSAPTGTCNVYQVREKTETVPESDLQCGIETSGGVDVEGDPIPLVATGIKLDISNQKQESMPIATDASRTVCSDLREADLLFDGIVYEFVATGSRSSGAASLLATTILGVLAYTMI
eukprot:Protomagalhaensia_wolfi_Nauph_80__5899@NODE_769_length_2015_cov_1747_795547_g578_i0_p2_GENE_NODE_769_length_2015_cov_1747_795547_g578_i0NODE_769_length_2015_cov_1747_795547_g578_i0_p2_ORF_typecomplete_len242_score52_93_NODE_769_length_2015_cov_1747_795547_g578_i0146871